MVSLEPGLWIASLLSIGYLSVVVKDNIFYRIAVETLLGASVGNWIASAYVTVKSQGFEPLIGGQYLLIVPIILGLALLAALHPKYSWFSRYGNGFLMGVGCGVAGGAVVFASIIKPIRDSILPWSGGLDEIIGRIILLIGLVSVLSYFFLTIERKGYLLNIQRLGRYFIMLMLGLMLPTHQNWNLGAMQQMLQMIMYQWLGIPSP